MLHAHGVAVDVLEASETTGAPAEIGPAPTPLEGRAEQANCQATARVPQPRFPLVAYWIRRRARGAPLLPVLPKTARATLPDMHREVVACSMPLPQDLDLNEDAEAELLAVEYHFPLSV